MVSISKFGDSAIKFTFDDSDHYLMGDGEITVPVNGLILVLDESDMATFKKIDGDPFISFNIADSNFSSKSDLETFYKDNMVGSTGGGGGVTSGEVQTMIDESISGLSDDISTVSGATESLHSAVTELSGQVNTDEKVTANALVDLDNRKLDASAYTPTDLSNYYTKSQTNTQINNATDSLLDAGEFYEYTSSNDERVGDIEDRLSEDEEVTSAALNEVNDALSGKADTTAVTASIAAAVSGKQDTLVSGTNIKTINNESLLGSGNIDIQGGGGKAIEAGRGIEVTTGATADTINCTLPISAGTGEGSAYAMNSNNVAAKNSFAIGSGNTLAAANVNYSGCFAIGYNNSSNADGNFLIGRDNSTTVNNSLNFCFGLRNGSTNYYNSNNIFLGADNKCSSIRNGYNAFLGNGNVLEDSWVSYATLVGNNNKAKNNYEVATGRFNNSVSGSSTFGDSGNTLFSVGNGTANNARHNAFEIRQNGDIYITSGGTDIKLQDNLGGGGGGLPESAFTAYTAATEARLAEDEEVTAAALNTLSTALGGFKLVSISQADYDLLPVKDPNTLYIITNVVN